jgi:Protein of unknown function (DUF1653)
MKPSPICTPPGQCARWRMRHISLSERELFCIPMYVGACSPRTANWRDLDRAAILRIFIRHHTRCFAYRSSGWTPSSSRSANNKIPALQGRHLRDRLRGKLEVDPDVMMMVCKSEEGMIWTRPKAAFFGTVRHEGQTAPRFTPIGGGNCL